MAARPGSSQCKTRRRRARKAEWRGEWCAQGGGLRHPESRCCSSPSSNRWRATLPAPGRRKRKLPRRERRRGRHVPAAGGRGVGEARDDDAGDGRHDSGKKHPGHPRDGADVAIEERGDQQTGGGGGEIGVVQRGQSGDGRGVEAGPEDREKTREADAARGDRERRSEARPARRRES